MSCSMFAPKSHRVKGDGLSDNYDPLRGPIPTLDLMNVHSFV